MNDLLHKLKALADETRLRLIHILRQYELNVNELVSIMDMGQSRISRHLKILADAGLLRSRRDGVWVFYSAAKEGDDSILLDSIFRFAPADELSTHDLDRAQNVIDDRINATADFFDAFSPEWDSHMQNILSGLNLSDEIIKRMPSCNTAVDLGCGTGAYTSALLEKADYVIGVDASPKMLERAERRFKDKRNTVSLRIGRLEHLPLRDGECDFALACLVLHHLVKPELALQEARRVLNPGGFFLVADFLQHNLEEMRTEFGDRRLGFATLDLKDMLHTAKFDTVDQVSFPAGRGLKLIMLLCRKRSS